MVEINQNGALAQIAELRSKVDGCDKKIVALLAQRYALIKKIGEVKRDADLPVYDPRREAEMFSRFLALAQSSGVPQEHVFLPFVAIMHVSKMTQSGTEIKNLPPIVPKMCMVHGWKTCGIEVPGSRVRVCPTCRSPLV